MCGSAQGRPIRLALAASEPPLELTLEHVREAAARIREHVHRTPTRHSRTFSSLCRCDVWLKLENLQRTGSFKTRGALNHILALDAQRRGRGVVAASSGNHAQGVAFAASAVGVPATIVMPTTAPIAKVAATRGYGARVKLHGQLFDDAHAHALAMAERQKASYVHPFDDWKVMAGQGTIALELLEDVPDLEVLLVPVGGGGLVSGIAIAARALSPTIRIVGVQAEGADACARAFHREPAAPLVAASSIADAVSVKSPGEHTLEVISRYVDDVISVPERSIAEAMVLLLEREKTVAEGAGALGLAALLTHRGALRGRKKVGVVISGGNVDLTVMDRVIQHGLTGAGRILVLTTALADRPGELHRLAQLLAKHGVNILEVDHRRLGLQLPLNRVALQVTVETRDRAHGQRVVRAMRQEGYPVQLAHEPWEGEAGAR